MLTKRIIPCLDVMDGNTVKGINFQNLQYAGHPVELAKRYNDEGADELVFLDITATNEKRKTILKIVEQVATSIFIPFTVGGGISTVEDIRSLLLSGADKVSMNSAAVKNPDLIAQGAAEFGSQCIVVAIDVKKVDNIWKVFIHAGQQETDYTLEAWLKIVASAGAGEILLTSMDYDGTQSGFDLPLNKFVAEHCNIPVIASGGAKDIESFTDVFCTTGVDAALAASIFHYDKINIYDLKWHLRDKGVPVRL